MKKILLFFVLGLLYSCQIQYDVSTRFVFEGFVQDRNGNPIANNSIEAWVYNSNDSDFIGYTETNLDGRFELIIPKPTNETDFSIKIKGGSVFNPKDYVNIWQSDLLDYSMNLGTITLIESDDVSQLEITLNQINAENSITNIEVDGLTAEYTVWVNPLENEYENPYYYDTYYKPVAKNQNLNLHYEIYYGVTGETESFNEIIVIGSNDVTEYNINY